MSLPLISEIATVKNVMGYFLFGEVFRDHRNLCMYYII